MRKTFLSTLLVGLALALSLTPALAQAQQPTKPIVAAAFPSYNELMSDIGYLGQLGDKPDLAQGLEGLVNLMTGGGLQGMDKTKPWGIVLGADMQGLAFVPVTDAQQLIQGLANFTDPPKDAGNGVTEITSNNVTVYVKEQNGWAFIAQNMFALGNLPEDPLAQLDGLEKEYDLAVRANIQSIPAQLRQMAIDQISLAAEQGLQKDEEETEEEFQLRQKMMQVQLEQLKRVFNELDQITLGWSIDQEAKKAYLDIAMTATPGSQLAEQIVAATNATSRFTGFSSEDAMVGMVSAAPLTEQEQEQLGTMLSAVRNRVLSEIDKSEEFADEDRKATVKDIVGRAMGVLDGMIQNGKIDMGATVVGEGPITVALGLEVADPAAAEKVIMDAVGLAQAEGDVSGVERDVDSAGPVKFHAVTPKLPPDAEEVKEILGENPKLIVGVGPKSIYLALGEQGVETLKQAIAQSGSGQGKPFDPHMTFSLKPILEAVAKYQPDNPLVGMLAATLTGDDDEIRFVQQAIPNGARTRIEAEEGVLRVIGTAAASGGFQGEQQFEVQPEGAAPNGF